MVAEDLLHILEPLANEAHASFIQKTAPTQNAVFGLSMPQLKKELKPVFASLKKLPPKTYQTTLSSWVDAQILECSLAAFLALDANKKQIGNFSKADLLYLNQNLDNWILIDYYGTLVTGYAWRKGILHFEDISGWMTHANIWQRRLAITSCIGLDRGLKANTESSPFIAEVALHLATEPAPVIYKAISWMLRFHISRDRTFVVDFMKQYGTRFHTSVQREVMAKLETGKKA